MPAIIAEVHRVLRPGGLFICGEFQNCVFDASTKNHSAAQTAPNLTRAMGLIDQMSLAHGAPLHSWREIPLMLRPECDLWREIADEKRRGFTRIRSAFRDLPSKAWDPTPRLRDIGIMMEYTTHQTWVAVTPMFIRQGLTKSEADELSRRVLAELVEPGSSKLYFRYHFLYAFKPM